MTRKAIVAAVSESWVDLLLIDEAEQFHSENCDNQGGCGSSGCGCRVSGRPFKAAVPMDMELRPGDGVLVSSPLGLGAIPFVFGVPAGCGIGGWFLAVRLLPNAPEGVHALAAALGVLAAAVLLLSVRRKSRRLPEIISRIEGSSAP
ncbi:MAG: hypothetical protein B0D92_00980 [Spirochaeta sp. LUC14_002_19_P3]|nr:MAG: hypothetical protein B0D92_00980 [Spirochaeta sp. LUC14_002_19_P3]